MRLSKEQLYKNIVNEAKNNELFKLSLISNPSKAIKELTSETLHISNERPLKRRDHVETTFDTYHALYNVYDDKELNEGQLEMVAGGHGIITDLVLDTLEAIRDALEI
ncbi:hypothetical protein ACFQ1M_12010 [Sungkyunkwania multivorans]|uniref:Uncharacterized protein n=1 Tax=Sungkyunkwania multivorans TaxID=1173618 RepID=A0ABW3CZF9_9FLAO